MTNLETMNMGYLRDAIESDVDLLFEWANEEAVRKNSFSTSEIAYSDHIKWFKNILTKDNEKQYIFMYENQPAGQIRIKINEQEAEIGYSICVEKRKLGLGKEMIALLYQKVKQDYPNIKRLTAKVKPDNTASQKVFSDTGYALKFYAYEIEME